MNNTKHSPQRQREQLMYRYHKALEAGDFETVALIMKAAEQDAVLNQMLAELDAVLEAASDFETPRPVIKALIIESSLNGLPPKTDITQEKDTMTTSNPYWEPIRPTARHPNPRAVLLLILAAALLIGGFFLFITPRPSSIMSLVMQAPTSTPTAADIAKLYVEEIWGHGDKDVAAGLLATDFVDHEPLLINRGQVSDKDTNNAAVFGYNIEILRRAFPVSSVTTDDVIITNDRIVIRWTFTGTHKARFFDIVASDKIATFNNTDILVVKDGKIVERWGGNKFQQIIESMGIETESATVADGMSAFSLFAYLFSNDRIDDFGDAFTDDIVFNQSINGLEMFKTTAASIYEDSDGISNMRVLSAYVIDGRFIAQVEFYTNNSTVRTQGRVEMTLKDGKIATYDFFSGG